MIARESINNKKIQNYYLLANNSVFIIMVDENKDAASATSGSSEETRQVNIDEIISKVQDAPTEVICDVNILVLRIRSTNYTKLGTEILQ